MKIEYLRQIVESCNLNFLIGSGCSSPYLTTLGNIESLLTELENNELGSENYLIIKASLYAKYFRDVIYPNTDLGIKLSNKIEVGEKEDKHTKYDEYEEVQINYQNLFYNLNKILLRRHSQILSKQVNFFTTNIDLFIEKGLETKKLEINDGFKGRINPIYDQSNFYKSYNKRSAHYDNVSEIPVFNILKLHGSTNWVNSKENIVSDIGLNRVQKVREKLEKVDGVNFLKIDKETKINTLISDSEKLNIEEETLHNYQSFLDEYDKLLIVNPTKAKFNETVLEQEYYEMLRFYSNSLEKENTVLFVLGFSFADEHIRQITKRVSDSNPTLQVIVFSYSNNLKNSIDTKFIDVARNSRNRNIKLLATDDFIKSNIEDDTDLEKRLNFFDLKSITNEVFANI